MQFKKHHESVCYVCKGIDLWSNFSALVSFENINEDIKSEDGLGIYFVKK